MSSPPGGPSAPLAAVSLLLQAGGMCDRRLALHLAVDVAGEVVGAAADEIDALRSERLGDLVALERRIGGARKLVDHLLRRAGGCDQAEPQAGLEAGQPGLRHSRKLGRRGGALG